MCYIISVMFTCSLTLNTFRLLQVISHFIFALYFQAKGFPLLAGFCLNQAPFCTGCYRLFRISFSPCILRPKGFRFWQVSVWTRPHFAQVVTEYFAFHFRPVFSGQRVSAFGRFLFEPCPVLHRLLQVISHFIFALYFQAEGFPLLAGFCLNQALFCTGCYRLCRISFSPCIFRPKGFRFWQVSVWIRPRFAQVATGYFAFHFRPVFSGQRVSAFGRFLFESGPVLHRLLQVISHFIFALYFQAKGFPLLAGFCLNQAPFFTGCCSQRKVYLSRPIGSGGRGKRVSMYCDILWRTVT